MAELPPSTPYDESAPPTDSGEAPPRDPRAARPAAWTSTTYFAEGFPYTLVNGLPEILFKEFGATLETIGLTSLLHLPWNLKFLWGPFLDRFGTKRRWLLGLETVLTALLAVMTLVMAGAAAGGGMAGEGAGLWAAALAWLGDNVLLAASVVFLAVAFASATHDIAIDGYYLEALSDAEQPRYVGTRATAYRVAMLVASGPLVLFIGRAGWTAGFAAATVAMAAMLAWHARYLPRVESAERPIRALLPYLLRPRVLAWASAAAGAVVALRAVVATDLGASILAPLAPVWNSVSLSGWIGLGLLGGLLAVLALLPRLRRRLDASESFYAEAFVDFLGQERIGVILGFVVLFRAGESFLLKMRYPFLRDIGITIDQYGMASGTFGVIASFAATIVAGWAISKHGLRRWIWPFVLGQNVLNLLYAVLAWHYTALWTATAGAASPEAAATALASAGGPASIALVTGFIVLEATGAGLGTAVFMVFLMRCCRPGYKAAHMAILTALMSVSFTLAGVASGFLASAAGFTTYFAFTFLATLPAMALIPRLPHLDEAK